MERSTNQTKQDADEVRWVTAMAKQLGLALATSPVKQPEPMADVLMSLTSGRHIGVEVVEAMNEAMRRGYSGTRKRLVCEVTDELRRRRINANVGLSIPEGFIEALGDFTQKERRAMCTRIVACAAEALASPLPRRKTGWIFEERDSEAPREDNFRYVGGVIERGLDRLDWMTVTRWHEPVVITGVRGTAQGPELIQYAIDKKKRKHSTYDLRGTDELWLLVVGGAGTGGSLSSMMASRHTFCSPFAKTVFLECWEDECVVLRTPVPGA